MEVGDIMKRYNDYDKSCSLCEYANEISQGELCICRKKGIVTPGEVCSRFQLDPLKIKVSVRKLPKFDGLSPFSKKES